MTLQEVVEKLYKLFKLPDREFYNQYHIFLEMYEELEAIVKANPIKKIKL